MATATEQPDVLTRASAELAEVCGELSRLTSLAAPPLHAVEPESPEHPLFVYGILGGKDVGKTTLINALADALISHEASGIGVGTRVPVVYVHRDDAPYLRGRLDADAALEYEVSVHDREVLRHVALVDLPDFDSKRNLPEHARRAAEFKPFLDAFIWVTTVRKIDHPELLRQMMSVAPKRENFYCVVTFGDEVIASGKDTLEGLRRLCLGKVRQLYFPDFDAGDLFAICTLDRGAYDFPRLTHRLVRRHSPEEIAERRHRSALRAVAANVELVRAHYRLDESLDGLARAICDVPGRFGENLPPGYWGEVADRVSRLDGPYRRQAARLFTHRVWGWPILGALLFPLSSIVSYLGGRLFFESGGRWSDYDQLPEILSVEGLALEVRLRRVAGELHAKFLRLHELFGERLAFGPPGDRVCDHWAQLLDQDDRATIDALRERYRAPGFLRRWLVYLPLLWFPLAQPVLENYLRQPDAGWGRLARGTLFTLVSLLSAGYILRSAAVLAVVYTVWLLWFYASSARRVARQRLARFAAVRDSVLVPELLGTLTAPYEHLLDTLRQAADRLARLRGELEAALGTSEAAATRW